jgi:hypothetical protein
MHPPRRLGLAVALVGGLLLTTLGPTVAAWDPAQVLRSVPGGTLLSVQDMAALGSKVVVGWQEEDGQPRSLVRWTTDAGANWSSETALDTRARRELKVDTCAGRAWATSALHDPGARAGEWLIVIDGLEMDGPGEESSLASVNGQGRKPDIACAGNKRLAVAWFRKVRSGHRVKLFSRGAAQPIEDAPPEIARDLGRGSLRKGISVAATADRVYVAFFRGERLDIHRFAIGPAPEHSITPLSTSTLGPLPYAANPVIAASGARVVLAYTNRADLVARVSTDRGATWGRQRTLRDEPFPSEMGAFPTNVDVRGRRVLVSGVEVAGLETPSGKGFLYGSRNGGGRWSLMAGSSKGGAKVVGALMAPGGTTKMVQAWDGSLVLEAGSDPQKLRFRRQT